MYTISLTNLVFTGTHGLKPKEKKYEQRFALEIQATALEKVFKDDIKHTIDYGQLKEIARKVIAGPHCDLIETLAVQISDEIITTLPLNSVTVTIQKLDIWHGDGVPGVSITRHQSPKKRKPVSALRPTRRPSAQKKAASSRL